MLGFQAGSSESAEACKDLMSNLIQRRVSVEADRRLLAVLDGSHALLKAPELPGTLIQRCLVYKGGTLKAIFLKGTGVALSAH